MVVEGLSQALGTGQIKGLRRAQAVSKCSGDLWEF